MTMRTLFRSCCLLFLLSRSIAAPLAFQQGGLPSRLQGATLPSPTTVTPKKQSPPTAQAGPLAGSNGVQPQGLSDANCNRNLPACYEGIARTARAAGRNKEAFEYFMKALHSQGPLDVARRTDYWRGSGAQPDFWYPADQRDYRLMTEIIALAKEMNPPPEIPEGARRYFENGRTAIAQVKVMEDFELAQRAFGSAVNLAPWWAQAQFSVAVAWEKLGNYSDAISALRLYLLAAPNASNMADVRTKLLELERRKRSS
jgi:tetratricopeptide (TPR) repeat protein